MKKASLIACVITVMAVVGNSVQAEQVQDAATAKQVRGNPLRDAYYGELHLHTNQSMDAYIFFNAKVDPDTAYRFGRGEPVPYMGRTIRRKEPLDFMAVTDHAENIGVYNTLDDPESPLSKSEFGQRFRKLGAEAFWSTIDGIKTAVQVRFDFEPLPEVVLVRKILVRHVARIAAVGHLAHRIDAEKRDDK